MSFKPFHKIVLLPGQKGSKMNRLNFWVDLAVDTTDALRTYSAGSNNTSFDEIFVVASRKYRRLFIAHFACIKMCKS